MTRNEEIKQEAINQCTIHIKAINGLFNTIDNDKYNGFIAGARWADKTMFEKSCEWLLNNAHKYQIYDAIEDNEWYDKKQLLLDFKKYMKE